MNRFYATMFAFVLAAFLAAQVQAGNQISGYTTGWVSFTANPTWTTNTTVDVAKYRLYNGDTMDIVIEISLSGAPNSTFLDFDMPAGWQIDTTNLNVDQTLNCVSLLDSGTGTLLANVYIVASDPDLLQIQRTYVSGGSGDPTDDPLRIANVTQAAPFTFASGDGVTVFIRGLVVEPE